MERLSVPDDLASAMSDDGAVHGGAGILVAVLIAIVLWSMIIGAVLALI